MELKKGTLRFLNHHVNKNLEGKLVCVTGSTSGIGLNAVRELLYLKADILMAVRNVEKAESAKKKLLEEFPDGNITIYELDLSDLESVKKFVTKVKRSKMDVHAFVNNAGTFSNENEKTKDGYPMTFGTNYIGTYLLTERLIPYFKTLPHEVILVNTVSIAYKKGKIKEEFFYWREKKYSAMKCYNASKLALTRYSLYLANVLMDSNIRVVMSHPGVSATNMVSGIASKGIKRLAHPFLNVFQNPEKSALSVVHAITGDLRAGTLVGPDHLFQSSGYPKKNRLRKKAYLNLSELCTLTKKYMK